MAKNIYTINVEYDQIEDIVTIEGIHYTGEFFRMAALAQVGTWFRVEKNKEGALTFFSPHEGTAKLFDAMTAKL